MEFLRSLLRRRPSADQSTDEVFANAVDSAISVIEPPEAVVPPRFARGPLPSPFARVTVGLTFDGGVLRIVAAQRGRIVFWDTVPFDPRMAPGAAIAEPFNLGRFIRDAIRRRGVPTRRLHCAISGAGAIVRVVDVPGRLNRRRKDLHVSEALRSIGISPSRHYVFSQPLDPTADSESVFCVAIPRDVMRSSVETMRAAGVRPRSFDTIPLAIARGIGAPDAVIVSVGQLAADIAIIVDDLPLLVSRRPFGSDATLDEARELTIDALVAALREVEDTYVGTRVSRTIPIYLVGDAANDLRLADRARRATGHPIGRPSPMIDCPEDFPADEYLANVGLILKEEL
ncbi:MAG: hypothetical protein EPO26_12445 [Chloroflexota bacterium]|nr:MAG: hypothetical protein EPO26_12445 [Chloroflexota bacterium]